MKKIIFIVINIVLTPGIRNKIIAQDTALIPSAAFVNEAAKDSVKSELYIGIARSSNAVSSGRDYGVKQYSIAPSITYYHKSGLYAGIAASILYFTTGKLVNLYR